MAITYQSGNTESNTGTSLTITKPSGLAEGDLMIAFLGGGQENKDWTASGWTLQDAYSEVGANSSVGCLYKVANSSDVAASNFTFTWSGTSAALTGHLARITGTETTYYIYSSDSGATTGNSSATYSFSVSIPETENDIMLILFNGTRFISVADGSTKFGNYAVVTDDPTWTERADSTVSNYGIGVATAPRSALTDPGNWSLNINTSGNNGSHSGIGLILVESVDKNQSIDAAGIITLTDPGTHTYIATSTIDMDTAGIITTSGPEVSVTTKNGTSFTNQSKNSSSWANQSKS